MGNFWKKYRIVVLFCILISALNIIGLASINKTFTPIEILITWVISISFLLIGFFLLEFLLYLFDFNKNLKKIPGWVLFILANIPVTLVFLYVDFQFSLSRFFFLFDNFGDLKYILHGSRFFLGQTILFSIQNSLNILEEKKSMELQNEQLRNENLNTRFEVLKQQTNPHFLFNALNTLRAMIRENDSQSEEFVIKLSSLYRELLNKKELPYISLEEELALAKSYIFLIKCRFQDKIELVIQTNEEKERLYIPTFALQILIENCIKHNIISSNKPLLIQITQLPDKKIQVENNLQRKNPDSEVSGTGLQNIRKRYELLKIGEGLEVEENENYFRVRLKLIAV